MIRAAGFVEATRAVPQPDAGERPERCHNCSLVGAELCQAVRAAERNATPHTVNRRFRAGTTVVDQGAQIGFVGVLRNGIARRGRIRLDGKRVLFGMAIPGDIVGGLPDRAATCAFEAATDLDICMFDSGHVQRLLNESPDLKRLFIRESERQHQRMLGALWRYGSLDSRERIIAFLVAATEFMPTETQPDGSLVLTIDIPRRDWADLTNTAVETISRVIRYLADKNLVESLTAGRFLIRDLDRLALIAGVEPPVRRNETTRSAQGGSRMKSIKTLGSCGGKLRSSQG